MTENELQGAPFSRVLDFGVSPDAVAERDARQPHTEDQIAALIVDEDELRRLGRWGGHPQPKRWTRIF